MTNNTFRESFINECLKIGNMEWLSQNWVDILIAIISAIGGGFIGFRIGVNKKQRLSQKAGNNSTQIQSGRDVNIGR